MDDGALFMTALAATLALFTAIILAVLLQSPNASLNHHLGRLAALVAASLALGHGTVIGILMFATAGLGVAAVHVLFNVTLYYAAAMPGLAITEGRTDAKRWLVILALPLAIAVVPALMADVVERGEIASQLVQDVEKPLPGSARFISVSDTTVSGRNRKSDPECTSLCQRLLAEGHANRVRTALADFTLEDKLACEDALPPNRTVVPGLIAARARGLCLVAHDYSSAPVDLTIARRVTREPGKVPLLASFAIYERDQLIIWRGAETDGDVLVRRSRLKTGAIAMPLLLHDASGMGFSKSAFSWTFLRKTKVTNPYHLDDHIIARLAKAQGVPVEAMPTPADEHEIRQASVRRLLDGKVAEPFSPGTRNLVIEWSRRLPYEDVDRATVELLKRAIQDRRMVDITVPLSKLSRIDRKAVESILPDLIARMEAPPPADPKFEESRRSYDIDRTNIGHTIALQGRVALARHADRIVALVENNTESWTAGLVRALGKLPFEASALIRERLGNSDDRIAKGAALAACLAPAETQLALKEDLIAALDQEVRSSRPSNRAEALVKALIRMGEKERVIALYGAERWNKSMRGFNRMEAGFKPNNCR